jgi:xanthine dehydrogenase molybdenum-binding subunit
LSTIDFVLNGSSIRVASQQGEPLLEVLRNRCGIRSTKDGCQPQGQCGACLVLVDGHPKVSCAMPIEAAAGREITTLEGIDEDEQRLIARCFVTAAGVQCGFCIPGIALRAHHLLTRNHRRHRADGARPAR